MPAFTLAWFGQLVSLTGTAMSRFALSIWAWQATGSATALALVVFFSYLPTLLITPVAGALVDRWNRKLTMALTDAAAGVASLVLLILFLVGNLEIWHLYVAGMLAGVFEAFQWPAFSAAISTMLTREQYARANGMLALAESASGIAAPLLAGFFLSLIGIGGILIVDVVTVVIAVATLSWIVVPAPPRTEAGSEGSGALWRESLYGFRYIFQRPSLLGLQLIFLLGGNLPGGFSHALLTPYILLRSGNSAEALGTVLAAGSIGGVVGGLLMSTWGGPRQRVHGVLLGLAATGLLGEMLLGIGRSLPMWIVAAFLQIFFIPILNGCNQAIWQAKVAPDVQGRVFAARRFIGQATFPIATLSAGPLADFVFEPAMQPGGALVGMFGGLVGSGPGAGIGLLLVLMGLSGGFVSLAGYLFVAIRDVDTLLPDHEATGTV
ncbi:MAG: MFS transporter [Chloroflexaceae bacterium]|nr:MFS transporter [Chloroflexaceae bacterium]NJO07334.1 MFS transporter [Chloroflexaceae bacterium]